MSDNEYYEIGKKWCDKRKIVFPSRVDHNGKIWYWIDNYQYGMPISVRDQIWYKTMDKTLDSCYLIIGKTIMQILEDCDGKLK